ncbi:MAG: hypothetical protein NTY38_33495, partial [Acidobacteria bacterium]|nr:hypothetical protein [Acidobacteriota bacterium]
PWRLIAKKLAPRALVVSLSPYLEGYGRYAELIVPAPAFLESMQEAPAAPDAPLAGFALAPALIPAREGTTEPVEFVARLAGETVVLADELKKQVEALHKKGKGEVVVHADATVSPLKEFKTADDLWKALTEGACWRDPAAPASSYGARGAAELSPGALDALARRIARVAGTDSARPLTLVTSAWRATAGNAQVSPLLTKVYQESDLRSEGNSAAIHPGTSRNLDLKHSDRAVLTTACGSCPVEIIVDPGVMPGVIAAMIGPTVESISAAPRNGASSIADICAPDGDSPWRVTSAALRKA